MGADGGEAREGRRAAPPAAPPAPPPAPPPPPPHHTPHTTRHSRWEWLLQCCRASSRDGERGREADRRRGEGGDLRARLGWRWTDQLRRAREDGVQTRRLPPRRTPQ